MQQLDGSMSVRSALVHAVPALATDGAATPDSSRPSRPTRVLRVHPFGAERDLELDGRRLGVGRLKVIEFAGLLALHPAGIARSEVTRLLFPDSEPRQAGNYFRQITHKVRELTGIALVRRQSGLAAGLVALPDDVQLRSTDAEVEAASAGAPGSPANSDDLRRLLDGVRGRYLEGSVLPWAEQRRNRMDVVEEEARVALARLLATEGHYDDARAECERVVARNRYSDSAYRLLFAIERETGSEVSCMAVYRRAADALRDIGLCPGDARRLFQQGHLSAGRSTARRGGSPRPPVGAARTLDAVVSG